MPGDFWFGVFFKSDHPGHVSCEHNIWVVLIPMFPLHVTYWHKGPAAERLMRPNLIEPVEQPREKRNA